MTNSLDELLDTKLAETAARLKKSSKKLSAARRALSQALITGEISKAKGAASKASQLLREEATICDQIVQMLDSFAFDQYMNTQFEKELFRECALQSVGIAGSFPKYRVASFLVEVKPQSREILINGRKAETGRSRFLAGSIRNELEALGRRGLPPATMAAELVAAYDLELAEMQSAGTRLNQGLEIPLPRIYHRLTPGKLQRLKYPLRQFSHDIHIMLSAGIDEYEGRRMEFKAARSRTDSLRVVLPGGNEVYYGSLSVHGAKGQ